MQTVSVYDNRRHKQSSAPSKLAGCHGKMENGTPVAPIMDN